MLALSARMVRSARACLCGAQQPFRDTRMAIRSDGLGMILTSNRPGGIGPANTLTLNLWVSTRASNRDPGRHR